jgi:ribulose-5-phosphate 4-epimerase/fuculose-1-phosphate aldolase
VLSDEEGRNIAQMLGPQGKGIILQNHGILTASMTFDATVAYFIRLEKLCQAQLESDAAGGGQTLGPAEVDEVFGKYGSEEHAFRQAQELYEWLEAVEGDVYKQ